MSNSCAVILASLLQYARHPATPNAPHWVSIMVPEDFLPEVEKALAEELGSELYHTPDGLAVFRKSHGTAVR